MFFILLPLHWTRPHRDKKVYDGNLITSNFPWFPQLNYQPNNIDIGTKILYFQCFVTTDMFLFCKPTIFSGNCRICRDLAFGSVKTRFKAILKKLDFSAQIDFLQLFGEMSPKDAQSFKSQEIRVKLKRMYFVVRPCKPTKN